MRGKEAFSIRVAEVVLRHPPVSKRDIHYEDERFVVQITSPVDPLAWKLFLMVLSLGRKVKEGGDVAVYEVPEERLEGALGTENMSALEKATKELMQCLYRVEDKQTKKRYLVKFLTFACLSPMEGMLSFHVARSFEELRQEGLWYYFVFANFLRSQTALNLHAFLSANTTLVNVKEKTLISRGRLNATRPVDARIMLRKALEELVRVGFLRDYTEAVKDGERVFVLQRPEPVFLRAKAQELLTKLYGKIEEFKEKRRQSAKESMRRKRKKEHV